VSKSILAGERISFGGCFLGV